MTAPISTPILLLAFVALAGVAPAWAWTRHYCHLADTGHSVASGSNTITWQSSHCTNGLPTGQCVTALRRMNSCADNEDWGAYSPAEGGARVTWWNVGSCSGVDVAVEYLCGTVATGITHYSCGQTGTHTGAGGITKVFTGSNCVKRTPTDDAGTSGTVPTSPDVCISMTKRNIHAGTDEDWKALGPEDGSGTSMNWWCGAGCGNYNIAADYLCFDSGSPPTGYTRHRCSAGTAVQSGTQYAHFFTAGECSGGLPTGDCFSAHRRGSHCGTDSSWSVWTNGESINTASFVYTPGGTGPAITWHNTGPCAGIGIDSEFLCGFGTCDPTPATEGTAPTLTATFPKIESNLYKLSFTYPNGIFESISVTFAGGNADCNLVESNFASSTYWDNINIFQDPECTQDAYFARNVQNMLGNCGFTNDAGTFTNVVTVTTKQNRTLDGGSGASSGRTQNYYQIKDIEFKVQITIPTSIEVNSTASVFGNITVLRALVNQYINVTETGADPTLQFVLRTSSQYPYILTYTSANAGQVNGNTGTVSTTPIVAEATPACSSELSSEPCEQDFSFSGLAISYNGTACTLDTTGYELVFTVNCTSTFIEGSANGGCNTPSPNTITISIDLTSSNYCPSTDTFTPVPDVSTYQEAERSTLATQYVVGGTVYGVLSVTIPSDAVTITDVVIDKITTDGFGDPVVAWDTSNQPNSGVTVDTTTPPNHQAHFDLPLINGVTVSLDNNNEAAQGVVISVDGTISFTPPVSSKSHLLSEWSESASGRSVRLLSTDRPASASSIVSLTAAPVTPPSSAGSASSTPSAATALVAAVAAVAVVAAAFAYRRGRRKGAETVSIRRSGKESTVLTKSSSTVDLETV